VDKRSDEAILENRAGNAAGVSTSFRRRVIGRCGVAIGLGVMMAAASASAQSAGVLMPPAGDYLIRWYQPNFVRPVDNWQIEVTRHRTPGAPFIVNARMSPDDSCWALFAPVNEPATVRIRSVAGAQVSVWSRAASVPKVGGSLIRWYQPGTRPIEDWEVEVATNRNPSAPYILTALVMPDPECWALAVPVTESANVRMRSVSGSQISAWSRRTSVPEASLGVGAVSATVLLAGLDRRRRRRS
jgi:hypothetical protein